MKQAPTKLLPSVEFLRECFTYDRHAGILCWKVRPSGHFLTKRAWHTWNARFSGKVAGSLNNRGYYKVEILGTYFLSHRVVWKLVIGDEPPEFLDHSDGDRANNRWSNLRAATRTEQNQNSAFRLHNTSGHRGVYRRRGKWQVSIRTNGVLCHLGCFNSIEDAVAVREAAARKLHGEFYREPSR
jgi:hypothetical protein